MAVSADMVALADMAAVVAAIADGTDRDRHRCLPQVRSPVPGRAARPPAFALPNILKTLNEGEPYDRP